MNEPLVRDGVLYVFGYGDSVLRVRRRRAAARCGATSASCRKARALPSKKTHRALRRQAVHRHLRQLTWSRSMRAPGGRCGTSPLTDKPGLRIPGGPLAADGVVMQGLATPGGRRRADRRLRCRDRRAAVEFDTVAKPGQPGGDSWNGLAARRAQAAARIWTSRHLRCGERPRAVGRRRRATTPAPCATASRA